MGTHARQKLGLRCAEKGSMDVFSCKRAAPILGSLPIGRSSSGAGRIGQRLGPRDVPALASALLRFVHNPGLVATMGAQSRRLAEERFDVNRINQKLMEVLGVGAKRHSEG